MTEIIVDGRYFPSYAKSTIKNAMANKLKIEKKVAVISLLCEGASIRAVEREGESDMKTLKAILLVILIRSIDWLVGADDPSDECAP